MIGGEKTTCPLAVDYFVSRVNPLFSDIIGHIDQHYKSNQKISIKEVVIENNQKAPNTNAAPIIDLPKLQNSHFEHHRVDIYAKDLPSQSHRMELDNGPFLRRPGLHVYLDPKFVTSITIPGVELQVVNIATSEPRDDELSEVESYSVARSSDSDSLHVDEDLFNSGYFPKDTEQVLELESSQDIVNDVQSSLSSSYDPVKDLYEILSNSKERLVVAHALKGTYREPSLHSWMESHVASINSSSRYSRIDNASSSNMPSSSSSSQDAPPLPARGPRSFHSPFVQSKEFAALQVPNLIANSQINSEESTVAANGQSTAKVSNITERNWSRFLKWLQQFRKHFQNRRNVDAAKIVATTCLGLIAFGVITALSLGINRV